MNTNKNGKTGRVNTKRLVMAALFAAISLAVKPFELYILPVARFNFVGVPIIMSGIVLGPVWGGAVGAIADIAGFLFFDKTGMAINPVLTFANIMLGVIPGLIFLKKKAADTVKKLRYDLYNVISYVVLLVLVALLLLLEGSLSFSGGTLFMISPSSGEPTPVSWFVVGLVAAAFVAYSIGVILMFVKKDDNDPDRILLPKILFAVTAAMIIGDIIISGLGLGLQYGWPLSLMLVVRIIKGFFTIPVYTFLCSVIYKAVKRFKV